MTEILELVFQIAVLTFVVGSMISLGLSLTVSQILEPLIKPRLVILSLAANFIFVPLLVFGLAEIIPVSEGKKIAFILLSLAAGAPFLPKLAEMARSDIAFSIGLMLLLMVVTVIYLPFALPLILKGTTISAWLIARSLIVLMMLPLTLALWVRARFAYAAQKAAPWFGKLTSLTLTILTIVLVMLHFNNLLAMFGYGMLFIVALVAGSMAIGYVLGGPKKDSRLVLALGTGQRNISAAIVVAMQNFKDPEVTITLVVAAIVGLFILMPSAALAGKKTRK